MFSFSKAFELSKAKYGELFDDDFTKANDVYELASMWVGRNRNLAWEDVNGKRGLQKELGWTRKIGGDTKYIETLLAKNGEGVGVDEFVHMVWESPENDIIGEKRFSTEEIKEALLTLLKSAQSKSDVVDFALNNRIARAEATLQQQAQMAEEQQNIEPAEVEPAPDGGLPFGAPTDEDFTNDVNENNNEAKNDVSLQQAIEEVGSEINNGRRIRVVNSDADIQELIDGGVSDIIIGRIISDLQLPQIMGRYIPELGEILLYPQNMNAHNISKDEKKRVIYHENIHGLERIGYTPEDFKQAAAWIGWE